MVYRYMLGCIWVWIGCGCFGWHVEVGSQSCVVLEDSLGCVSILLLSMRYLVGGSRRAIVL